MLSMIDYQQLSTVNRHIHLPPPPPLPHHHHHPFLFILNQNWRDQKTFHQYVIQPLIVNYQNVFAPERRRQVRNFFSIIEKY